MGLFDKVKSLKNALTGGGASVTLDSENVELGHPFKIAVRAQIGESDIKAEKIYLYVYGQEDINIDTVGRDEDGREYSAPMKCDNHTVKLELDIDGPQTLTANEEYTWEVDVELPENAPPIYQGCYCRHLYHAMAGIDCFGNDPDSGWIELPH